MTHTHCCQVILGALLAFHGDALYSQQTLHPEAVSEATREWEDSVWPYYIAVGQRIGYPHIDPQRCALVIIDMQPGAVEVDQMMNQTGHMSRDTLDAYQRHLHETVWPNLEKLIGFFRDKKLPIIHVTLGAELEHPRIQPHGDNEWSIHKGHAGVFRDTRIDALLQENNVDTVFITGVGASACVSFSSYEAMDRGYQLVFIDDATENVSCGSEHDAHKATAELINLHGYVKNTEQVMSAYPWRDWVDAEPLPVTDTRGIPQPKQPRAVQQRPIQQTDIQQTDHDKRRDWALLVVDLQDHYVEPDGFMRVVADYNPELMSIYQKRLRETVLPNLERLITFFRANEMLVVYTIRGNQDRQPSFSTRPTEPVIKRTSNSAVKDTDLTKILKENSIDTVYLAGIGTSHGVTFTAYELRNYGYNVVLLEDALVDFRSDRHKTAMKVNPGQGRVSITEQIVAHDFQKKLPTGEPISKEAASTETAISNQTMWAWGGDWAPDSTQFVYTKEVNRIRHGYLTDANGLQNNRLTHSTTSHNGFRWSPREDQVVFYSNLAGNTDIYTINADGMDLNRLTNHPANDWWPQWSPDGGRIAFVSFRDGNDEIYVMNEDGIAQKNLSNHPRRDRQPAWSPSSREIAFVSCRDYNDEIYLVGADGGDPKNLTNHNTSLDESPAWSPDGKKIAFVSDRDGNYEIYVMHNDGTGVKNLTRSPSSEWWPVWSPDGSKLAFISNRNHRCDIYVMNADGAGQVPVTNDGSFKEYLTWSPNGTKLAFTSLQEGTNELVFLTLPK